MVLKAGSRPESNKCRHFAITTAWGGPLHCGIVPAKNDICCYCIVQEGIW